MCVIVVAVLLCGAVYQERGTESLIVHAVLFVVV